MMPDQLLAQFSLPLVCAALLFPLSIEAKTDTWYQVELIVFSHPAGNDAEQWDATPNLAYPSASRLLADEVSTPVVISQPEQAAPTAPLQPAAFTILPSSQQALRNKAAAIQRSSRYQILFHEAWNQQMTDQANALPIVLDRSGDGGAWPELQGTIKLYVARYLYLETNLWLNTRGEYLPGSWRMPAPPIGPSSLIFEAPEPELELELEQPQRETITADPAIDLESQRVPSTLITITKRAETLEPIYPFRHAVRLHQTRRMRSGEVHYIDHPMLGVIVKITPLPDPRSQATPQAESE
tara:strand:- start:2729 stop:3619 length:891 start_codon:yes stop_codon:yes gene_type:complete